MAHHRDTLADLLCEDAYGRLVEQQAESHIFGRLYYTE
jgi:hypothetical protein